MCIRDRVWVEPSALVTVSVPRNFGANRFFTVSYTHLATGDLSYTYTMTGVIQQLLDIIDHSYGITLDRSSVNVGRFITHLRYLFVRIHQHQQLTDEPAPVMKVIRESYPAALRCARTIASLLELRLDTDISDDETAYLAMHVARVTGHAS